MARTLFLAVLLTSLTKAFGQAPVAGVNIKPSGCIQENFEIENTSVDALTYRWDFCLQDIKHFVSATKAASVPGLSSGTNYRVVKTDTEWVGFVTSYETNSISRVSFSELGNVTSVTNLGNLGGIIVEPYSIDIMFNNGEWYGFVGSLRSGQGVVKLKFGNSLTNTPAASNIGSFGFTTSYNDVQLIRQSSDIIMALIGNGATSGGDGSLITINFGNSLDNLPSASDIFSTPIVGGATAIRGFDLINKNSNWFGLFSTNAGSQIISMKFGADIQTAPLSHSSFTFGSIALPFDVQFVREGSHFYAAVASLSLPVSIVDLGELNGEVPTEVATPTLPTLFSLEVIRHRGKTIIQGTGLTNEIQHIAFESPCESSIAYSELEQPPILHFSSDGIHEVEIIAIGMGGQQSVSSSFITISQFTSPDITITKDQVVCEGVPVAFQGVSTTPGDIVSYTWQFGDASTGAGQNPQHSYATGKYQARVEITGLNNCMNFAEKPVEIYEQPEADFELPNATTYCTNQLYVFDNTSDSDPLSPVEWTWFLNDDEVATTKEFSSSFADVTSQKITLRASIPGCQTEKNETIPGFTEGPIADFTVEGHCQGTELTFTNSSSGQITGYEWTIEGQNFETTNAAFSFASAGNKIISLTALSASGCNNNTSKVVQVFSLSAVDFEVEGSPFSCNGKETPFADISSDPIDSDIESFRWNFDDPGSTANNISTLSHPSHKYEIVGSYNVELIVTTDKGCSSSLVKQVNILQSPSISFENGNSCLNKSTSFTALSDDAVQFYWEIGTAYYETKNMNHVFNSSGSHAVKLRVVASNDCVSEVTRNVLVPVPIDPVFTVTNNCKNFEAKFTTQFGEDDPVIAHAWNFSGEGSSTDDSPVHTFNSIGNKLVTLQVTTAAGCVYQRQTNVSVVEAPIANFIATPESGVPPQEVSFSNLSSNGNSYHWNFDDGTASTEFSPHHTFTSLGDYDVELTVSNKEECRVSLTKVVSMIAPLPDVDLSLMTITHNNDGTSKVIITIANKGNTVLRNLPIQLDVSGNVTLETIVTDPIGPFSMYNLILNFSIARRPALEFLCASITLEGDLHPEGNRICNQLKSEMAILPPYPNPVKNLLTIEWVAQKGEKVRASLVDTYGKTVIDFTENSDLGLNQKTIDVEGLLSGIYILRIESPSNTRTHRILIGN